MEVERVPSFRFLGATSQRTWTLNTSTPIKKAHRRLLFPRRPEEIHTLPSRANCVTVWFGRCSVADRKALQRVVKNAQRIMCIYILFILFILSDIVFIHHTALHFITASLLHSGQMLNTFCCLSTLCNDNKIESESEHPKTYLCAVLPRSYEYKPQRYEYKPQRYEYKPQRYEYKPQR